MNSLIKKNLSVAVIIGVWSLAAVLFPDYGFSKQLILGRQVVPARQEEVAEAGAVLKTDPELEDVLEKAERMRNDGHRPSQPGERLLLLLLGRGPSLGPFSIRDCTVHSRCMYAACSSAARSKMFWASSGGHFEVQIDKVHLE